jgi:amino acid permease
VLRFICPLIGGTLLIIFFLQTSYGAMYPSYRAGSLFLRVGIVFILGVTMLIIGVIAMGIAWMKNPVFFRNGLHETLDAHLIEE